MSYRNIENSQCERFNQTIWKTISLMIKGRNLGPFCPKHCTRRELLIFSADCNRRTGRSLTSTFNKFPWVNLCVVKRVSRCVITEKECWCTDDFPVRVVLPLNFTTILAFLSSCFILYGAGGEITYVKSFNEAMGQTF